MVWGGDRGKDRGREILMRRTLVKQGLQVGFREHPATRGNRVKLIGARGQLV